MSHQIFGFLLIYLEPFLFINVWKKAKEKLHLFFLIKFRFSCTSMITYIKMQSYNVPIMVMFPSCASSYGTD